MTIALRSIESVTDVIKQSAIPALIKMGKIGFITTEKCFVLLVSLLALSNTFQALGIAICIDAYRHYMFWKLAGTFWVHLTLFISFSLTHS